MSIKHFTSDFIALLFNSDNLFSVIPSLNDNIILRKPLSFINAVSQQFISNRGIKYIYRNVNIPSEYLNDKTIALYSVLPGLSKRGIFAPVMRISKFL